jgi:hypothetical protein
MVRPDELVRGRFYILLVPGTTEEEAPSVRTCFYIGRNLFDAGGGDDLWYFQGTKSFLEREDIRAIAEEKGKDLYALDEASLGRVHDFPGLVSEALLCGKKGDLSLCPPAA